MLLVYPGEKVLYRPSESQIDNVEAERDEKGAPGTVGTQPHLL